MPASASVCESKIQTVALVSFIDGCSAVSRWASRCGPENPRPSDDRALAMMQLLRTARSSWRRALGLAP
jgi:hypothetical protein